MSGAASAASGASGARSAAAPRPVTRGEEKPVRVAHVDWLNATFPKPSMTVEGFVSLLGRMLGRPVSALAGKGLHGFKESVRLIAHHGSQSTAIGFVAWGGEAQNGRWLFSLEGQGCAFVHDWAGLADLLESLDAKLTRVDLALDFLDGEYGVDEALDIHACGGFAFDGKMSPKTSFAGDWLEGVDGRTLYVGKASNGKMLRVYEKGRQLGDPDSEWCRFEVQLGNRDRVLPFEVLTDCDAFFAGAYPALADLVDEAARRIPTSRPDAQITLADLGHHLRRCYGKVIHAMTQHAGASHAELIEGVRITALPRRLDLSSVAAGVTWADVHARMEKLQ
jgi:phage replication initiation protein